jgi:hypothetical protein
MPEDQCNLTPSDWLPYLQRQKWFIPDPSRLAENFPYAVEHFLNPKEFRREFFMQLMASRGELNAGYRHLANLFLRRLSWTVLTPNFDPLIVEAVREKGPSIPEVVEINRTGDDLIQFKIQNRCQIVYLHGAVEFYRDKNLVQETKRLDEALVQKVRPLLSDSPIIVVGYRGAEESVMHHLLGEGVKESYSYRQGVYWCLRPGSELHPHVEALRQQIGANFHLLEIAGFDELMAELDQELDQEIWFSADAPLPSASRESAYLSFDSKLAAGVSMDSLDHDLILATLAEYCKRLKIGPVTQENLPAFLRDQGLARRNGGGLVPTLGCYLLFGRDVGESFPHVKIAFERGGKKRKIFDGNLITQFRRVLEHLNSEEINPLLRIKRSRIAEEQPAYPDRAIVELLVNLLVHRDYAVEHFSTIEFEPGRLLRFQNPGGLLPQVLKKVALQEGGRFAPVRGASELRNPRIADIFYGLGSMDKAGSGLPDVKQLMQQCGGGADFEISLQNDSVTACLHQALQSSPKTSRVATPLTPTEVYTTNLVPFAVMPEFISVLPLRNKPLPHMPLFEAEESPKELPIFVTHDEFLYSFADLTPFKKFAEKRGFYERLGRRSVVEFREGERGRDVFVWLVRKHWEFFLYRFRERGLFVEHKRRRAYFRLTGGNRNRLFYDSPGRKNIRRDVVKPRPYGKRTEYENEGIVYSVVEFCSEWAIQIKPFYVFTRDDGQTPLPSFLQSRRSTGRMKFDRNKSVSDDLTFWERFLSGNQQTISLGGIGVTDLILNSSLVSVDAQSQDREDGKP